MIAGTRSRDTPSAIREYLRDVLHVGDEDRGVTARAAKLSTSLDASFRPRCPSPASRGGRRRRRTHRRSRRAAGSPLPASNGASPRRAGSTPRAQASGGRRAASAERPDRSPRRAAAAVGGLASPPRARRSPPPILDMKTTATRTPRTPSRPIWTMGFSLSALRISAARVREKKKRPRLAVTARPANLGEQVGAYQLRHTVHSRDQLPRRMYWLTMRAASEQARAMKNVTHRSLDSAAGPKP